MRLAVNHDNKETPTFMNDTPESSKQDAVIEMFDEAGQKLYIPRSEYIANVLPHNIELHWDEPDTLASTIINAFNDGLYAPVEEAAKRLIAIDTLPERSVCLYGTVLLNTEQPLEAEALFLDYLKDNARHPYVLTNLAKTQDFLGKQEEAFITLEESITADPNQDNAGAWWQVIKKEAFESEGVPSKEAELRALKQFDERFGGWQVKVWLGDYFVLNHDIETARAYYEALLHDAWEPHVLTTISSELGKQGFLQDIIELIVPHYNPKQHEVETGLNLLQAYLELGKISEGEHLLQALYAINRPEFVEQLDSYKINFLNLSMPTPPVHEEALHIKLESIDYPLWCYGWNIKHGFDVSQSGKKIAVLQFSCESDKPSPTLSYDLEDTEGRLARAIPLFLLEEMHYGTNASMSLIFPVAQNAGEAYVLYGSPPPNTEIMALAEQGYDGVVTGAIVSNTLNMMYWDSKTGVQAQQAFAFNTDEPELTLTQLGAFICEKAGIEFDKSFQKDRRGFQAIPELHRREYLMLSSQHLTLYRALKHPDAIDEHRLIRGLIKLAKQAETRQSQLNLISVIHLCMRYKSQAIKDYKGRISRWLDSIIEQENILQGIAKKTSDVFKAYCDVAIS